MRQALRFAWYCFRATFGRRWAGYLSVVALVGLTGGIAMGAIAAARQTQSSYPAFLDASNPSDMTVSIFAPGTGAPVSPLTTKIAGLSGVRGVRTVITPHVVPLTDSGAPRLGSLADVTVIASADGMFLDQDRPGLVQGRRADPSRVDEMVMTQSAASLLGVHVGEFVPMGFYTDAQSSLPGFGTPAVAPRLEFRVRLVGIVVFNNAIVQDDIDRAYGFVILTPALIKRITPLAPQTGAPVTYALQLNHAGSRGPED